MTTQRDKIRFKHPVIKPGEAESQKEFEEMESNIPPIVTPAHGRDPHF